MMIYKFWNSILYISLNFVIKKKYGYISRYYRHFNPDGRDLFSYEFCKCEVKGQIKVKSGKNLMGKCDVNFAGSLGHFDMEEVRHVNTAEGAKRSEAVVTWQHLFQWPNESKGPAKSHHIYPFLVSKNKTHRKKNPAIQITLIYEYFM
ncbi:hypothetical protein TRFO_41012 [Tritrichomonas foetus]|uniref:Uncharacterized protein n=1 Tax=Tritrichomonas foetus TaxID=1144522 RepID=A0A1J4J5D5_9EUKA|nr:hypothetical protein TRFO_41012 [Tritrichomonas foetus]|eukprot:OHS92685.1 hypothetical protein TRFO_41012 [Tritrichomonas foetus]